MPAFAAYTEMAHTTASLLETSPREEITEIAASHIRKAAEQATWNNEVILEVSKDEELWTKELETHIRKEAAGFSASDGTPVKLVVKIV